MSRKRAARTRHDDERVSDWHLDKRIPIALILTLLFQGATAIWWASGVSADLDRMGQDIAQLKREDRERAERWDRLIVLETELKNISTTINKLEQTVTRVLEMSNAARFYQEQAKQTRERNVR